MFSWLEEIYTIRIRLSVLDIIFGFVNDNNDLVFDVFNFCILFAKYYVYECKIRSRDVDFACFIRILKTRIEIEKCIAIKNEKLTAFNDCWSLMYTKI